MCTFCRRTPALRVGAPAPGELYLSSALFDSHFDPICHENDIRALTSLIRCRKPEPHDNVVAGITHPSIGGPAGMSVPAILSATHRALGPMADPVERIELALLSGR